MTGLKDLILQEGLKKDFLVRIMRKLGYYHSGLTKGELMDTLVKKIEENDNANGDLVSLDMGLKNMSLARFSNEQGKKPTLIQWFKRDLESGVKSKEFRVSLTLQMLRDSLSKNKLLPPEIQLASPIMHHRFELSDTILENLSTGLKDDNIKKEWDHMWKFKSLSRKLWELVYFINRFNISPYTVPLDKYWWGSVKGDDLADSLLHGLAYSEYIKAREDFRKNVKEHGQINSYR
ncbi:hypothetical protein BOH78_3235 [Pichia kudriavzevii]|uniref:Mitochondrial resolvase Ydc2 catalytic domain-containing protein n=1 Tax=Pichia kudriavzevii TaxID=4909 RepID=A0A1V2LN10_PICKU|nr:hypothetical protein BOH78_3235 [Pichia kudriavzevii]